MQRKTKSRNKAGRLATRRGMRVLTHVAFAAILTVASAICFAVVRSPRLGAQRALQISESQGQATHWPLGTVPIDWPKLEELTDAIQDEFAGVGCREVAVWGPHHGQHVLMRVVDTGFPFAAMRSAFACRIAGREVPPNEIARPLAGLVIESADSDPTRNIVVPLVPRWPGFLLDTLFWGAISFSIAGVLARSRRYKRLSKALCPRCKYPIGPVPTCAECGEPIPGGLARALSVAPAPSDAPKSG